MDTVRIAEAMIVLASTMDGSQTLTRLARTSITTTNVLTPSATSPFPTLPLNRKLAVTIAIPICFLFLLAVAGMVLYCTRRQHPLRRRTFRRRGTPESHRDGSIEEAPSNDTGLSAEERDNTTQNTLLRPVTAIKKSDDGLSRITEIPSQSDDSQDRRGIHRRPPTPSVSPYRLPSSISSTSATMDPIGFSSDDFAGHFSGLDEDPFADSAAISGTWKMGESSPAVSPLSRPHPPPISSGGNGSVHVSRLSSDKPVTAINTGWGNSDDETGREQYRPHAAESPSQPSHPQLALPGAESSILPDASEQETLEPQLHAGRSRSVSAAAVGRHAESLARQVDPAPAPRSRSTEDLLPPSRQFSEVFGAPSSVPAPPLSERSSWLEERRYNGEAESPSSASGTRRTDYIHHDE